MKERVDMNKFITRGISKETGKFVYGYYFYNEFLCTHYISDMELQHVDGNLEPPVPIMVTTEIHEKPAQCLNRKDINNNLIYEGDKVKYYKPRRQYDETSTNIGEFDCSPMIQTCTTPLEPELEEKIGVVSCNTTTVRDIEYCELHGERVEKNKLWEVFSTTEELWKGNEGDLAYLLTEYSIKNKEELYNKLTCYEVIGNTQETTVGTDNE